MADLPQTLDADTLRREEFASVAGEGYLNAAAMGPVPERSLAAAERHARLRARPQAFEGDDFSEPLHRCRRAAARMIGAAADEIALGWNTSFGINVAALGLPLEPGATIVAPEGEFPTNVYPWMAQRERGVRFETIPADARGLPDEVRLLERVEGGGVAVLAISAVQFGSGYRADLARLGAACHATGTTFVVDAIQALGHVPIDVEAMRIDVLATGGHKWLCGPFGTGWAYVRRSLHDRLQPRVIGWTAMEACQDFSALTSYEWGFVEGARRYEVGTVAIQDFLGLAHSMELLLEAGIERIEAHVLGLLDPLVTWLRERDEAEVLSDLDPARRSGILAFRTPTAEADFHALERAGVVCSLREGAIRLSPHLYNTASEIARVVDVLTEQEWS